MNGTEKTKVLGVLGDLDPVEHGGGVVFETRYGPWVQYFEPYGYHEGSDVIVSDFPVDCPMSLFSDNGDVEKVASSFGMSAEDLREEARSDDPVRRADVYLAYARYYGMINLDGYPRHISNMEAEELYESLVSPPESEGEPV